MEKSFGLEYYYYGAKQYDPQRAQWTGIDPLADKYYGISPFAYVANNPVKYIDPDGRKIVIAGNQAALAISELQASTKGQLNLYVNKDGSLGASINLSGTTPITGHVKTLYEAINSDRITVNVDASNSKTTSNGNMTFGGAFMGNTFNKGFLPGEFDNTVETKQEINPVMLSSMDQEYGQPGISTQHEVLESYVGGLNSLSSQSSSAPAQAVDENNPSSDYYKAHNSSLVPKQSGTLIRDVYDANGSLLQQDPNTSKFIGTPVKAELKTTTGKVISTFP